MAPAKRFLQVSILNLDRTEQISENFWLFLDIKGFAASESPEQKRFKSLFMNEEESDVKLKIQDRIIPAHKHVLIEKSKYFANLFNSKEEIGWYPYINFKSGGMVESRQNIIDIMDPDFDFAIFQGHRFL